MPLTIGLFNDRFAGAYTKMKTDIVWLLSQGLTFSLWILHRVSLTVHRVYKK